MKTITRFASSVRRLALPLLLRPLLPVLLPIFLPILLPLAVCVLASLAPLAHAQAAAPSIGLVLGGGGARGAAHIGVLQKLQELRVPIDCVAGTSMGGLVAGAFSSGLSPADMQVALRQADWRDMFKDAASYADFTPRLKGFSQS